MAGLFEIVFVALCVYGVHGAKKEKITLSIDIGDEFMKVAAVNPQKGYPILDIVLNEQSERQVCKHALTVHDTLPHLVLGLILNG